VLLILPKILFKCVSRCTVGSFPVFSLLHPLPCPLSPLAPDNLSSLSALLTALDGLDDLCQTVEEKYETSMKEDRYERWVERS
jgi:hypothetical protein